ncbi:DUF4365 domain-containing protein [Marisediminicola sp. LYQ134]|uniref:DUF4365 domain-containing protein n=1 Tax=Marisediminicola sp. LYQ134 TaxID=3391061 RepID=UPI0039838121
MVPELELPERVETHARSTWSTRTFASIVPAAWLVHELEEDLGIDCRVEVFEDGRTTGIFFNVQLKATKTGSGQQPAETIKRRTLNYWAQTPDPTLVVIGHEPTGTLWYRWAHLLPFDANPQTKSRQVRCEEVLSREAAERLVDEAKAWRLARELTRHLPVDVYLTGTLLYGESAGPLKAAVSRKLAALPSFVRVVHSLPSLPYLKVSIEDTRVMVGLRGDSARQLTWDLHGPTDHGALASDVISALALACASVGAEDLCVRILKLAASDTLMLFEAEAFGYAVALLTRHEANDTVLTLMRRAFAAENHPARDVALTAFSSASPGPELRAAVAHVIQEAARNWSQPAMGIYNAANIFRGADDELAVRMFEEAATADPRYRTRGYWWREKGTIHWSLNDTVNAEACYREAIEHGDTRARALLGDVLMRTGRYRQAREEFSLADIWTSPHDAQWRLSSRALDHIVGVLGIEAQERTTLGTPEFLALENADAEALASVAMTAIKEDALDGWAHSVLADSLALSGGQPILAAITAAVTVNVDPVLWIDLLRWSVIDTTLDETERAGIGQDAMICAWEYFGSSFADIIVEEDLIEDDELRAEVLSLFEFFRQPSPPMELREHSNEGSFESFFIPTAPS